MLQSLDLDLLEDRRKAHRLNIFYLAVNNSIALPIPDYFSPKQRFTRSFSNEIHLFKPIAIMIIIFIVFIQGQ